MRANLSRGMKLALWAVAGITIGVGFVFLISQVAGYKRELPAETLNTALGAETEEPATKKPEYFYFNKNPNLKPKVSAEAYLIGDLDTGEVILQKNEREKLPIASVSKLVTALVTLALGNEGDVAQISKSSLATYGKNGNFSLGEKIGVRELLYPLLLESSNDAAEALAEFWGRDTFIKKMNQQADLLGLQDTYFDDSSGLSPNNQSTAADLFKLAGYINQKRADLFEITTKGSYSNARHNWSSNNQFLRAEGYLGGKSGFTDPALESVVSLFSLPLSESGTRNIAITLLRSEDRYKDVNNILKFLKNNIYYGGEGETDATWIKQKEGVPEIKDPDFATLSFLGDMMLDRGVKNSVMKNFGGDYSALFEHLEDLKKSDAVFANLEGTASDLGEDLGSLYSFRMDPSVVPALSGAGINVLSVANNHVGDFGREAYVDTLSRLRENEILYTGGGENLEEAEEPATMQYYGIKIGFLGFADNGPRSMEARADMAGFLPANTPRFDEIIRSASKQVDFLVVSFHFGEEYQSTHDERQEYLAHKAIDSGAKIVVGHHPHVMQDTEVYKDGYIAYSLGNFIFDQRFNPEVTQGLWLEVKLDKDGNMAVNKNIIKSNNVFQPDKIIKGKEEKIKFDFLAQ